MSKRVWILTALLAAIALAASAAPAFSDGSGAVAVSVTAQAPPAPCLTVTPTSVDFGTLPFSTPSARRESDRLLVRTRNCGTAAENVSAAGTDATGPSGVWSLGDFSQDAPASGNPCDARPNLYFLGTNGSDGPDVHLESNPITKTARLLGTYPNNAPGVWAPNAAADIQLELEMPCQGSNGAGETKALTTTFTAVVA
jgi:type 1 fimbria pilin